MKGAPFRYSSPLLQDSPLLYECPVGYTLREAPWVYDVIDHVARLEACGPAEWSALPRWMRYALRLLSAEKARLWEEEFKQREALRRNNG